MVSFGKNKDEQTERKHGYELLVDEEITDILLTEQETAPPLKAALLEPDNKEDEFVYELVVEDKNTSAEEQQAAAASLNEQVAKLCQEYEAINQQLEKSLIASNDLSKQLEKSKKARATDYVALSVASLAFLVATIAVVVGINMQRDVTDLNSSVSALTGQLAVAKKEAALQTKELDGRTALLSDKLDKILAADNLGDVLQVTGELQKQVHAMASKNLDLMNNHAPTTTEPAQNNPADKAAVPAKLNDDAANWVVTLGSFKDKTLAKNAVNKFKAAGISAIMIQSKVKKQLWYRLISKGFKDKAEAQKLAAHIKELHITPSAVLTKTR